MAERMQGRQSTNEHNKYVTVFHEPRGEVAGVYINPDVESMGYAGYSLTITVTVDGIPTKHTRHFGFDHYRVHVDGECEPDYVVG